MIRYFARHPTAANLLMVVFLFIGLISLPKLRRETFPDYMPTEVEIRVLYPGATAEEVEEAVCQRIEDALDKVTFVKELRSDARENLGIVTVEMEDEGDPLTFRSDIETEVSAIDDFPSDIEDPVITALHTTEHVLSMLVAGDMTPPELKVYSESLKRRLQALPEISLVTLLGFSDRQLRVELRTDRLLAFGLSVAEVADRIARQSINLPAGSVQARERDILIRFVEERRSVQELEDLIIVSGLGGADVRLGHLGRVTDTFEFDEEKVLLGHRRAAQLRIQKTKNQDLLRVSHAIKAFIAEERERHPNVDIRVTEDVSTLVSDRLTMLVKNGIQGVILVFLVLWLFFNLRLSFWVAMSLPVSFLGAFFFMPELDLTINMLTMVALLLALGLLMDDGIVIAENIASHRARGKSAMQAAIDGVNEVKAGVFSSFITTVCVLGPLGLAAGAIGRVLKVVPLVLVLVLAVSLVEAFLILPSHLGHSLGRFDPASPGRFRRKFDALIEGFRERVAGRTVDLLIRWRYLWVGVVFGVFLLVVGMLAGGLLQFQAFPKLEGNTVEARVLLPQGTPLARCEQVVNRLTGALEKVNARYRPQPLENDLVRTVYVRFNQNADAFENGPHVATVVADLLDAEVRDAPVDDVLQAWREETGRPADVISLVYGEPTIGPAGRAIEVRLEHTDLDRLKAAATEMRAWFSRFVGVYNLVDDLRPGKHEIRLRLREGALGLGLDGATVARQLRAAFHGVEANEIQVGPEAFEIDVRLGRDDRNSLSDLEYFRLALPDGRLIPLKAAVTFHVGRGWARIARVNGRRTVTLRGDLDPRITNTAKLIEELTREFLPALETRHPGIRVAFEGEIKEGETTRSSLMIALLIGLVGVFIMLSFQFRSYLEPLVVMVSIPLALIGVVGGHLVMGHDLSLPSIFGFISLAGVVVNDSILLVLFLKRRRQEGEGILESAAKASRLRFRAVVLTSLTTVAGLFPLLAEQSLQAQVLIPLVISIAFGLMASTVLVLLVIPCFYAILGDLGLVARVEEE